MGGGGWQVTFDRYEKGGLLFTAMLKGRPKGFSRTEGGGGLKIGWGREVLSCLEGVVGVVGYRRAQKVSDPRFPHFMHDFSLYNEYV